MPGNSERRGAIRKRSKGNPTAGSGGRVRRGLRGKGPTPPAEQRPNHKAYKAKQAQEAKQGKRPSGRAGGGRVAADRPEWIAGRNPVVEALRAGVPVTALNYAERLDRDDRVREAFRRATERGIRMMEVNRTELDRLTSGASHQGIAISVPPYEYADPADLLDRAAAAGESALLVALDGVTDPRNLGAVVRSAAAFGAHGVVVPERRAAGMTAAAWKASAGAALRVPVARAVNLTRALKAYQREGLTLIGLDAEGDSELAELDLDEPVVLVLGSEGKGLSRLVGETCDRLARIPIQADTESLNAGVAGGIALYEVSRQR